MAFQDLLETQESQVSQDPQGLRDFLAPLADPGVKVNQALQAGSRPQRVHRWLLSRAPQGLLAPWDLQDLQVPQALPVLLVSQDSQAREGSQDLLVNCPWALAPPSPRSSPPKVLICEAPQARLGHVDHLGRLSLAHRDPEAHQGKACQALPAPQDLS